MTFTDAEVVAHAAYVLAGNGDELSTRAAPNLYPHQWSWDAAFVAVGLAHLDVRRACIELDSLFAGQWSTGMIPHIVFDPDESGYFPGPERWASAASSPAAPRSPQTSGICQPPVHALAVERILSIARAKGGAARTAAEEWLPRIYPRLLAWHRYLARERDPHGRGLLTIYHGWESGMDNSPRWDSVYRGVVVGDDLPPYERRDTAIVTDASQRPTNVEYNRYLWLVEELKRVGYADAAARTTVSFRASDVFMSAVFAAANESLARLADSLGAPEAAELRSLARLFRSGVASRVDPSVGLALDVDERTGDGIRAATIAGFAPLICGGLDPLAERRMLDLLASWLADARLAHAVLPTTSPDSPDFRARTYWRGPSWPVMNWFFAWALQLRGLDLAEPMRSASVDQLRDGSLAEYYEPLTGEPLGSFHQSWTAAAALDLILGRDWR